MVTDGLESSPLEINGGECGGLTRNWESDWRPVLQPWDQRRLIKNIMVKKKVQRARRGVCESDNKQANESGLLILKIKFNKIIYHSFIEEAYVILKNKIFS